MSKQSRLVFPALFAFALVCLFLSQSTDAYNTGHSSKRPDHYAALGVKNTATVEEIRKAFHALSKTQHPDKIENPTQKQKDRWVQITQAYEILSDKAKRRDYDEEIRSSYYNDDDSFDDVYSRFRARGSGKKPRESHRRDARNEYQRAQSTQYQFQMPSWFRRYFHFNLDPDTDYGDSEDYGYFGYSPEDYDYRDDAGRFGSFKNFEKYMNGKAPEFRYYSTPGSDGGHYRSSHSNSNKNANNNNYYYNNNANSNKGSSAASPFEMMQSFIEKYGAGAWNYVKSQWDSYAQASTQSQSQSQSQSTQSQSQSSQSSNPKNKKNCYTVREETPSGVRTYRECEST